LSHTVKGVRVAAAAEYGSWPACVKKHTVKGNVQDKVLTDSYIQKDVPPK
jgi:hypothetical protein